MKKLFYTLAFLHLGLSSALAQDYAVGNTYKGVIADKFIHTALNSNEYPYILNYSITYLEDKNLKIDFDFTWENDIPEGNVTWLNIWIDGILVGPNVESTIGSFTTNKEEGYVLGEEHKFQFSKAVTSQDVWIPTDPFIYIVGSTNASSGPSIDLTGYADNITIDSAEIYYNVTLPEEYVAATLSVTHSGETVNENPIKLTDLSHNTSYDYELTATATLEGKETLTKTITVNFTTERDLDLEIHNYQIVNGFIPNAYLEGENPDTDRRNIPITYKTDIEYNLDKSLTIYFTVKTAGNIVGLVQEINLEGFSKQLVSDNGVFSYTTKNEDGTLKTFDTGTRILPFFYPQYNGGAQRIELPWLTVGETNDPVEYGEPVDIVIYTDKIILEEGERQWFCVYLVDGNGNFILDEKPEVYIDDNDNSAKATLDGDFITLSNKGEVTLVAEYKGLRAEETFIVATNIVAGVAPETCDDNINDPGLATDGNIETHLEFPCTTTEVHTISFDLGALHSIELIKLVWEGASAMEYTITLSDGNGNEKVYEVHDGGGGPGAIIYKDFETHNFKAQYVKLETKKAFDPGWGIKLKEIEVYGTRINIESGLYLVGNMTTEYDGGYQPNPSYKFTKEDNGNYTLEVASMSNTDNFYVLAVSEDGTTTSYSASGYQNMIPNTSNPTLVSGTTYDMSLNDNYVNIIFTLTPSDATYTLVYNGTVNNDVFAITPGNDKTNQSGTVDESTKTIIMQSENDAVLIYIYVPSGSTAVQYALTNITDINSSIQALADETPEYKNTNKYGNNIYTVSLATGTTGNLNVKYTNSNNQTIEEGPYQYTVNRAIPTFIDAIGAENGVVDVFTLQGICVKKGVKAENALYDLPEGIYIVGGKKVMKRN